MTGTKVGSSSAGEYMAGIAAERASAVADAAPLSGLTGEAALLNGSASLDDHTGCPVSATGFADEREISSASLMLSITGTQAAVEHEEDQGIGSQILSQMTEALQEGLVSSISARAALGEQESTGSDAASSDAQA